MNWVNMKNLWFHAEYEEQQVIDEIKKVSSNDDLVYFDCKKIQEEPLTQVI